MRKVSLHIVLALLLLNALPVVLQAQTVNQLLKAGDKKYSDGEYFAAAQYYEDAAKKDPENPELYYKLGEASRMFNDYAGAAAAYRMVAKYDKSNQFPLTQFWLGLTLRSICECKTEEALAAFKKFRNKYKKKDYFSAKAQQEMESCSWVIDHQQPVDSIKIEHLGKEVNSPKSEFNPIPVFPDKLQFSSLRNITGDEKNEKYLTRIYNQQPNPAPTYTPNGANESLHVGNGAYSPDSKRFFFTGCEQKDAMHTRCDIYVTHYQDFKWTPAEKLSDHVNDPSATNTQPSIGYDKQGNEVLFFASDRAGGQGNMDIWMARLKTDGTYEHAVNAGPGLNTQGNEITPFYDVNNKKLFFSSDWYYGYGAYDIFETTGEYTTWSKPQNLMQPINSPQNDLYYALSGDNARAYLTSNRKGSYFIESETCCNDIYAYKTNRKINRPDTPIVTQVTPLDTPHSIPPVVSVDTPIVTAPVTATIPSNPEPHKFIDETARKIKQLLPVTLYFHNDEPDAKNLSDTTKLDYRQTYEAYSLLRNEYAREYPKTVTKDNRASAEKEITELFTDKVDKGYYNLVAFTSQLLDLLQAGNKLEVTIKGYCSPLNFNEYNIKLGYRRVASLRNYFFHYRDGILLPYVASGALTLKNESLGEETAAKTISDNREDKPNSVYNPAAAVERRVEIVSVELK